MDRTNSYVVKGDFMDRILIRLSQQQLKTCHHYGKTQLTMAAPTKAVRGKTDKQSISYKNNQDNLSNKTDDEVISIKMENEKEKAASKADIVEDKSAVKIAAAEDLPGKTSHKIGEGCSLFPIHTWLYIILSIVLAVFGTLLFLCGNWANSGYNSFHAIINWPRVEVEDQDYHAIALEFLQLTCWICGFFFWLFALYLVYVVYVYHTLLWVSRPWDRKAWYGARVAADQVLVQGKVRDETIADQFDRPVLLTRSSRIRCADQLLVQGKVRDETMADQFDRPALLTRSSRMR